MKRFLSRAPSTFPPLFSSFSRHISNQAATIKAPLAENIEVNSDILRSLRMSYHKQNSPLSRSQTGGKTIYEVQTLESRVAKLPSHPITRLDEWREVSENILQNTRCYPVCVHQTLLEHCKRLVYSTPLHRRELLEDIKARLIESDYPVSKPLYNSYLSTVWALRQNIDLKQVFEELSELKMPLSYEDHESVQLADTVCSFLSLEGDTEAILRCFESFSSGRNFRGFTDRSFGNVAAAHVMRGEFEELFRLQASLERCDPIKLGYRFYSNVVFSLARTGNIDLLDTLLRKDKMACVTGFEYHFAALCVELIESGNEAFISNILPYFNGLKYQWGRTLEQLVCDVITRGGVRIGADLLVHGGDIFEFRTPRELEVFETETLPDIMQNMTENLDNILIQLELRGVNTEHVFDFDKISDDVVADIERLDGEFPDSEWIQKLHDDKMSKKTTT